MESFRILRIITRLNVGGPAWQAIFLHSFLSKDKFLSFLIAGKEEEREGNLLELYPELNYFIPKPLILKTLKRKIDIIADIKTFWRILRAIWLIKPHILHTHLAKSGTLGRIPAKLYRTFINRKYPKIIHSFHGHVFAEYFSPAKSKFFLFIERILAKYFSDYIIAISNSQKEELTRLLQINPEKIKVIPLGLPTLEELIGDLSYARGKLKEELNLPKDNIIVGSVARLVPIKGLNYLIEGAALLIKQIKNNVAFIIVGDGEERGNLQQLAYQLNLKDKIFFLGHRKDLPYIYADLDIALLTSLNEGTPVFLIEALVAGCPVIATKVGGVEEVLSLTKAKVLIKETKDPFAIKEALHYAIANLTLLKEEAKKTREEVFKKYNSQRLADDIYSLYSELLDET